MQTAGDVPGFHRGRRLAGDEAGRADVIVLGVAVGTPDPKSGRLVQNREGAAPLLEIALEALEGHAAAAIVHELVAEVLIGVAGAELPVVRFLGEAQRRRPDVVFAP